MSTLALATAIEPEIRTALAPMPGGYYRVENADGVAAVPSWWLRADSSAGINAVQDTAMVVLDIWHESVGDLYDALGALSYLRRWSPPSGGSHYNRESILPVHEEQGGHHAVIRWSVPDFGG